MNVPLLDLTLQYKQIQDEVEPAILSIAQSQKLILGKEVEHLEEQIADYCGVKYAIGVSSGTDALLAALMAIGVGIGDEVIIPTYSFFATAGVVARLNARPIFVDSDPITFNIAPNQIEQAITPKTKAIMPVHLFGQICDMDAIMNIAEKHSLPVIEDAAQAIGCQYKDGRRAGAFGLMGCFSFYPTKNLGCFGDGGMIVTNDAELAKKLKQIRNHGMEPKYYHHHIGGNFRLDAIQAAVLNVKLKYLPEWHRKRRENAALYNELFIKYALAENTGITEFDEKNKVLLPEAIYQNSGFEDYHIYNQYVIQVEKRDELRQFLSSKNIGTEIYYPVPFHRQPCFKEVVDKNKSYPIADKLANHSLALPIFPELNEEQIEYVVQTIEEFIKSSDK